MVALTDRFVNNAKNLLGWKTSRKLVVFAVDDYGNVRLHSKEALVRLERAGIQVRNRFDAYDTLETSEDLNALFEVLTSVKDRNGRWPVFTAFSTPCNIDFESMARDDFSEYLYESLPTTFEKLSSMIKAYEGAWDLWHEGIRERLLSPEFHGREHFNATMLNEKLSQRNEFFRMMLENRSLLTPEISDAGNKRFTAAFSFHHKGETKAFMPILVSGLKEFEGVFGKKAVAFTPPAQQFPAWLESNLPLLGIRMFDKPFYQKVYRGSGQYKRRLSFTRRNRKTGLTYQVRNVVFEPAHDRGFDWVRYSLQQMEAAFRWRRPVIVSSHRVNFAGMIDGENRKKGLDALRVLLQKMTDRWPDIEFVSSAELESIMVDEG